MYHNGDSLKEAYKKFLINQNMHQLLRSIKGNWAFNKKAFLEAEVIEDQTHFMTLQNVLN